MLLGNRTTELVASRQSITSLALLVATLAAVVAMNVAGLPGSFLSDNFSHVGVIARMDRDGVLPAWLLARFVEPLGSGNYAWRPVSFLSWAIDWRLFGANSTGWHVTNLMVHLSNALLVYFVARRWMADAARAGDTAALAAALFVAFPFPGEVTFWPEGRSDLLAAFFSLCFLATLGAKKQASVGRQLLRIVALYAALFAKESAMPLPIVAFPLAAALCPKAGMPGAPDSSRERLLFAARDLLPVWIAFAAYVACRVKLFGTPFKVYPATTLPSGIGEYVDRLATLGMLVTQQPDLATAWMWIAIAVALFIALAVASLLERNSVVEKDEWVAGACALAALVYSLAPALSFAAASDEGGGTRNYYVAWLYASLAGGLLAGRARISRLLGFAGVAWMLVSAHGSLSQWHQAARYMRQVNGAIPELVASLDPRSFALLALPDRIRIALFARNAQGAIVNWPTQSQDHLSVVAGVTELAQWKTHFETETIAKLKGTMAFDMRNFVGIYCFNPDVGRFVRVGDGGHVIDFAAWERSVRSAVLREGCLPETLGHDN